MSFKDLCYKARKNQNETLEYQNSRIRWLYDTLKVAEDMGLTVQHSYPNISILYYGTVCWTFRIETGRLFSTFECYNWRPDKQGKHHRISITSYWQNENEVIIDQIEKGEEGLAELRIDVQTWLANQIVKREIDNIVEHYQDRSYLP
jgi:hypothetical protein